MMNASSATRSLLAVFVAFFVVALLPLKCADRANEDRQASAVAGHQPPASVIHDWSTNRVIYPDTLPPGQYSRLANDPRYVNQSRIRRAQRAAAFNQQAGGARFSASDRGSFEAQDRAATAAQIENQRRGRNNRTDTPGLVLKRDWAVSLGTEGGVAEGVYPAKFDFNAENIPDCVADFVVFPVNASPKAGGQANIIAFNWLYSNGSTGACDTRQDKPSSLPNVLFAYAVGDYRIASSPVLSLDGRKIAFVDAGGIFHVLTWVAGEGSSAANASSIRAANATTNSCLATGSCDFQIALGEAASHSSVFVDYNRNVAWVGDDAGRLHRIRNVFGATPQYKSPDDVKTINGSDYLTAPVWDPGALRVIVSDSAKLYLVDTGDALSPANPTAPSSQWTFATVTPSIALGTVADGPMIDIRPDGKQGPYSIAFLFGKNAQILQQMYDWSPFNANAEQYQDVIGAAGGSAVIHAGTETAGVYLPSFGGSGFLYVCGNQGVDKNGRVLSDSQLKFLPRLWRFEITGEGKISKGSNKYADISTVQAACSPVAYAYTPVGGTFDPQASQERVFVGSTDQYMRMWNVSKASAFDGKPPSKYITEPGGTSAIVVDNFVVDTTTGELANIYFGTLAISNCDRGSSAFCAVKLTQAGLQ